MNSKINLDDISDKNEEEIEVIEEDKSDINIVIEKIEKVVKEIEELGYDIDLEKYDFDGLYQFVIKVDR